MNFYLCETLSNAVIKCYFLFFLNMSKVKYFRIKILRILWLFGKINKSTF